MERFDALIVGAGPAGSTAAFRLARAGARVSLIDKSRFPRDKPCGGGLTYRALRLLPFSVAPLVVMTQRRRLDAFLVEQAREAGAEFRDGAKVELSPLAVDGVRIDATVLIGADGVNGVTAKSFELDGHEHE